MLLRVFVFTCVFIQCIYAEEGDSCTTPLRDPGICIQINRCSGLVNLLRTQSANPEIRNYVMLSNCGFSGLTPLVCCPRLTSQFKTTVPPARTTPAPPPRGNGGAIIHNNGLIVGGTGFPGTIPNNGGIVTGNPTGQGSNTGIVTGNPTGQGSNTGIVTGNPTGQGSNTGIITGNPTGQGTNTGSGGTTTGNSGIGGGPPGTGGSVVLGGGSGTGTSGTGITTTGASGTGNGGTTGSGEPPVSTGKSPVITGSDDPILRPPYCGFSNDTTSRIVGGEPANLGEFPWIVALGYRNKNNQPQPLWLCGGSLITERHVLTAAHCVFQRPDLYVVRVGDLDLYSDDDGASPETINLIQAKVHENYNAKGLTDDIAILTMERKPSTPTVWPICLPVDEPLRTKDFVKYNAFVAGWGSTSYRGPSSSVLQKLFLPVVSEAQCISAYASINAPVTIDGRVLCAGTQTGGKDSCQGDSGGPFMLGRSEDRNKRFYQIGLVSFGHKCAEPGIPGVYTRVTTYIDWIRKNLS